ncbi:hypothetical protein ACIBMZ_21280 [Micromonospora sp. NPDC049900]|uniref:hypothetical protein n=1 Tax=Micromonospora sp. NPDC049900 TaxID=3364275 RepID=UPI00379C7ABD
MSREPYREGQEVWLVPTLMTAPAAAYRQPACDVIRMTTDSRVLLRLPDGSTVDTDIRNVRRTPPADPAPPTTKPRRRQPMTLPDGYAEQPLW